VAAITAGQGGGAWSSWRDLPPARQRRIGGCVAYAVLLTLLFIQPLIRVMLYAARSDLQSHVLLVPFIGGYLLYIHRWSLPSPGRPSIGRGTVLVAVARAGFAAVDVYPSRAVVRSSLTVLVVGGYLFVIGALAQIVSRFGGAEIFQFEALVVLLGMAGLAVLLLSDRLRQRVSAFVGRHFTKAQHDSVRIWAEVSHRVAHAIDQAGLTGVSARLTCEPSTYCR
jgi:hypothetical protein